MKQTENPDRLIAGRRAFLRVTLDLRDARDKSTWEYLVQDAKDSRRTIYQQIRYMLELAVYHETNCSGAHKTNNQSRVGGTNG